MGLRQIATGGCCDQSVSIRTPWTTLSRSAPRNPGHSALASGAEAVTVSSAVSLVDGTGTAGVGEDTDSFGASAAGGAVGGATGSSLPRASRRASASGVHLQWSSEPALLMPSVRTSVIAPDASRSAATIAGKRSTPRSLWLIDAHPTNPRHSRGIEKTGSIPPIIPFDTEG